MTDAELVVPQSERAFRSLELAERHFPPDRLRRVSDYLHVQPDNPALLPLVALCAQNGFSPTEGVVNLLPRKVIGGDGQSVETVWEPVIGRDGLLNLALRTVREPAGYRGMAFGVVCAGDPSFEWEFIGEPMTDPLVLHKALPKPDSFADDVDPAEWRGEVLGAWAKTYWDGRPPIFYYANIREHGRSEMEKDAEGRETGREVWSDFWQYTSAMALKCAQSYALRVGGGVTGFVPIDELKDLRSWQEGLRLPGGVFIGGGDDAPAPEFDWTSIKDARLRKRLRAAIAAANERDPFAWSPAKQAMVLPSRPPAELRAIVAEIEAENAAANEQGAAEAT